MKAYSKTRRSLLQFKNGTASFVKSLGAANLANEIKAGSVTCHRMHASFNQPKDPKTSVSAQWNLVGSKHDDLVSEAKKFMVEKGIPVQDNHTFFFATARIPSSADAWAKAEPIYKLLADKDFKKVLRGASEMVTFADGYINVRYMDYFNKERGDFRPFYLPQDLVEVLKNVDTTVSSKIQLNTSLEEVLKSETPMSELALQGFDAEYKVSFPRRMAKILKEVPMLAQPMSMGAPALGLSSDVSLDLSYSDLDDLKEHPMLSQFIGMTFNDIFGMAGMERSMLEDFDIDLSGIKEPEEESSNF